MYLANSYLYLIDQMVSHATLRCRGSWGYSIVVVVILMGILLSWTKIIVLLVKKKGRVDNGFPGTARGVEF